MELDAQLNEKKVFIQITPAARRYLAEKGYDPTFGARPMARLIQTEIKRVLADEILFGRLRDGGRVEIDVARRRADLQLRAGAGRRARGRRAAGARRASGRGRGVSARITRQAADSRFGARSLVEPLDLVARPPRRSSAR